MQTEGRNPGTEDGAVVDMHLLKCVHAIIITSSSSFGWAAAGLAGLRAYYVTEHSERGTANGRCRLPANVARRPPETSSTA